MLLHQRIDFTIHDKGNAAYVKIPTDATLWTTIERRYKLPSNDSSYVIETSSEFPSRILESETFLSVIFSGVDASGFFPSSSNSEYHISWRVVHNDESQRSSLTPPPHSSSSSSTSIVIPIRRPISLTCSHGNSKHLGLIFAGIDIEISYDPETKTLSTDWFLPPLSSLWSFNSLNKMLIQQNPTTTSFWKNIFRFCCFSHEDERNEDRIF